MVKELFRVNGYTLISPIYKNSKTNLYTKCPVGHDYHTALKNFRLGKRCGECAGVKKKTIEQIKELFFKEGYLLITEKYVGCNELLHSKCPNGHNYYVRYSGFRVGNRCSDCSGYRKYSIEEARIIFEKENYILLAHKYKDNETKLHSKCEEGHDYFVTLSKFLGGNRCTICSGRARKTIEEVGNLIKEYGYKLVNTEYINGKIPLPMICNNGHECSISYSNFSLGRRCLTCSGLKKKTLEEIRFIFEKEGYKVISTEYVSGNTPIETVCPKGKSYFASYSNFAKGYRCRCCVNSGTSKPEIEILNIVKNIFSSAKKIQDRKVKIEGKPYIKGFEIDIFVPELGLGIEYDGPYHHSFEYMRKDSSKSKWSDEDIHNYHEIKDSWFATKGIRILHVKGNDWKENKESCINKILEFLGAKNG